MTFDSLECWDHAQSVSGTITLPTNWNFTAGTDYNVVLLEGLGSVDDGTKTATTFDVTVTAGPCIFRVFPTKIGAVTQVS